MMDLDSTRTCPLASSPSASLEPLRQVMLAQPPLVAETTDGAMITKTCQPLTRPLLCAGAQGKLDSQEDRTCGRRTMAQILGRGYVQKLRIMFLKQETLSPTSFAILSFIFNDTRPQQRQGVRPHSGVDKGIYITFFEIVAMPDAFS